MSEFKIVSNVWSYFFDEEDALHLVGAINDALSCIVASKGGAQ